MWDYLPDEIICEILWRLPLNSIIRCSCVCKSYYSLITSRNFLSTHLLKTKNKNNTTKILLFQCKIPTPDDNPYKPDFNHPGNQIPLLFHNPDDRTLDHTIIHLPTDPFFTFTLLGSLNGILCLLDLQYLSRFVLSNPSIRRSLSLPIPQFVSLFDDSPLLGFGFDPIKDDYKIVRILKIMSDDHWAAEVYSLNSNCWSPIDNIPYNFCIPYGHGAAFANGALHWIVCDCDCDAATNFILVFRLNDETFHRFSLPKHLSNPKNKGLNIKPFREYSSIIVIQQTDDVIVHNSYTLNQWVMKNYGAAESWITVTDVEVEENFVSKGITTTLINNSEFFENIKKAKDNGMSVSVFAYVPSLVLLDKQNINVDVDQEDAPPTKRIKL